MADKVVICDLTPGEKVYVVAEDGPAVVKATFVGLTLSPHSRRPVYVVRVNGTDYIARRKLTFKSRADAEGAAAARG
jgi:hypothetical protein